MKFCSSMLWGLKVQVPCDPLPTIYNDYGVEDWMRPIHAGFGYGGNMTQDFYWNETDYSRVQITHSNLRNSSSASLFVRFKQFLMEYGITCVVISVILILAFLQYTYRLSITYK